MTKLSELLAKNVRVKDGDDSELRASMQLYGWHKDFPALVDENGVWLTGHRRKKVAKELNIAEVTKPIKLGSGDAADVERVKIALISNIGRAPLTAEDRKHIAEHLYGTKQWTQEKIAEALGVSQRQISNYVANLEVSSKLKPAKTATNPKGAGRPKTTPRRPEVEDRFSKIEALKDAGLNVKQIATEVGVGPRAVHNALKQADIRKTAAAEIDRSDLSLSARQKLDAAIGRYRRELEAQFERRHRERFTDAVNEYLPELKAREKKANETLNRHKGPMPRSLYLKIVKCLHPDRKLGVDERELNDALVTLKGYEHVLVTRDKPMPDMGIPKTFAEWEELKRKTAAERKAKRRAGSYTPARR
jgi:ParB-like chromosome segregation protein Spo0J